MIHSCLSTTEVTSSYIPNMVKNHSVVSTKLNVLKNLKIKAGFCDKKLNKLTCLTQNYCQFDIVILFNTIKIGQSFKELECLCKQACNTCSIQVLWSTYLKE